MVQIKIIKDTEKCKVGEIVETSSKSAENYVTQGYAEYYNEESISMPKAILDRWATVVVDDSAPYLKDGEAVVDATKRYNYGDRGYTGLEVLWIPPKDSITIEHEDDPKENQRYIAEEESACKSLGFDYCVTGHKGKSDYLRLFNIKGMSLGEDNKLAKMLLIDMIMTAKAKNQLDRTNLGWTFSPIIGHKHWKPKYNGNIHQMLRGKNPLEHNNEYPKELLKIIEKSKKANKKYVVEMKTSAGWLEDFFFNYCCNNELPKGSRHWVIEKNLAAYLIHHPDRENIKRKYYEAQKRNHDSMRTWELEILRGNYTNVSAGEIYNFIKEYNLNYEVPTTYETPEEEKNIIQKTSIIHDGILYEQVTGNRYAFYKDNKWQTCDKLDIKDITYIPCQGAELEPGNETVIMPDNALEYGDVPALVNEIKTFIHQWLDVSPEFETFAAWYVLLTYVYDQMPTINYLSAMGDTGVGKSRFLNTVGRLCYKAITGSGAVSVAAVKRIVQKYKPGGI